MPIKEKSDIKIARGLCVSCTEKSFHGSRYCRAHLDYHRQYMNARYQRKREEKIKAGWKDLRYKEKAPTIGESFPGT